MTETRETKAQGFDKWAYLYCLNRMSQTARDMAKSAYSAGREDALEECQLIASARYDMLFQQRANAQTETERQWADFAWKHVCDVEAALRSLSSKKDGS